MVASFIFNKAIDISKFDISEMTLTFTQSDNITPIGFTIEDKGLGSD